MTKTYIVSKTTVQCLMLPWVQLKNMKCTEYLDELATSFEIPSNQQLLKRFAKGT